MLEKQGNKGQSLTGTEEQRQYWETGYIRKQIFDFGEQGTIYFKGTMEQVLPGRASFMYMENFVTDFSGSTSLGILKFHINIMTSCIVKWGVSLLLLNIP